MNGPPVHPRAQAQGRKIRTIIILSILTSAAALASAAPEAPIDQLIGAERAFAAQTRERGVREGFLATMAPNAFTFAPGPTPARPIFESIPLGPPPPGAPPLDWWPDVAAVARSGDLGFTSGGASIPVRYFTVWQRQPDGSWRWIYDGGPRVDRAIPRQATVRRIPVASGGHGSAERARRQVWRIELQMAAIASRDHPRAVLARLAPDAIVGGSRTDAESGRLGQLAELGREPRRQALRPLGTIASSGGDLVFAWGETGWTDATGSTHRGHYARIWQRHRVRWQIIANMTIEVPRRGG